MAIPQGARTEAQQDKIIFIMSFFDELRRIAPVNQPDTGWPTIGLLDWQGRYNGKRLGWSGW